MAVLPMPTSTPEASPSAYPAAPRDGIHAALWLPTDGEGALRRDLLMRHLDFLKQAGLHGILALGSTGEFVRMSLPQREDVLAGVVELADSLPIIANISSIRLDEVIALGRAARRFGAVGAAIMPPSFFPLAQDDILEFFLRAAAAIDLPVYLYNYPEVTCNRIGLEVISAFADRAPMIGIKQSGGELSYHPELIALGREKKFSVFTAADPFLATYLEMGAAGCFGGFPNFIPEYMMQVYGACRSGASGSVVEISHRLGRLGEILEALAFPLNIRCAVESRGFDPGALKSVVSLKTESVYHRTLEEFRVCWKKWNLPVFPV